MLCPHAMLAARTAGRRAAEPKDPYRTEFQRDRDRILHAKAFRRLKRKTQVFLTPEGDHYRTRLTHTLEVMQIARSIARALFLNEDLTEAVALGHDLGHTPFGHAGEAVLDEMHEGGFRHYEQSVRVVEVLEPSRHGRGLNLTEEVRDGILHHSTSKSLLLGHDGPRAKTLEGLVVSIADAIAYVNHDIDDAIRGGIITIEDLPQEALEVVGRPSSTRISTMVTAVIEGSGDGCIAMIPEVRHALNVLRNFLYREVYPCERIESEIRKAKKILRELYGYLAEHPDTELDVASGDDPVERRVVDHLAGMTDQYALRLYARVFFPAAWQA
jgi:dGTPase